MAFYHRIPQKFFWLIPSLYFMLLGGYNIGADMLAHTLRWQHFAFNAALFLPIIFRHRYVYIFIGAATACMFGYFLFALFVWLMQFMAGRHFKYPLETFGFGIPFCVTSLLLAIMLVMAGCKRPSTEKKDNAVTTTPN